MPFAPATKYKLKARIALEGPPGCGKTYSALAIATALAGPKGRIALIDSEGRRSELNSHLFRFDVQHITNNHPRNWARMIEEANQHNVLICDSFSQEWNGRGGCLELVDEAAKQFNGNSYFAWGTITPMHNEIIQLLLNHSRISLGTRRLCSCVPRLCHPGNLDLERTRALDLRRAARR